MSDHSSKTAQPDAGRDLQSLLQRIHAVEDLLLEVTANPVDGSPLAFDDEATAPFSLSATTRQGIVVAVDHLHGLRLMLREDVPVLAGFTVLRSALEAALAVTWSLLPNDAQKRRLRLLQDRMREIREEASIRVPVADAVPHSAERAAEVTEVAARVGFEPREVNLQISTTEKLKMLDQFLNDGALPGRSNFLYLWKTLSAVAHGRAANYQVLMVSERVEMGGEFPPQRVVAANLELLVAIGHLVVDQVEAADMLRAKRAGRLLESN